jgi:hypothetical protein
LEFIQQWSGARGPEVQILALRPILIRKAETAVRLVHALAIVASRFMLKGSNRARWLSTHWISAPYVPLRRGRFGNAIDILRKLLQEQKVRNVRD